MGNYYGASCMGLNWHENQYDLVLQPGEREGDPATVVKTIPDLPGFIIHNGVYTGRAGSGDNAYIYTAPFTGFAITSGTIPMQKGNFNITGSLPDPAKVFKEGLISYLQSAKIIISDTGYSYIANILSHKPVYKPMQLVDSIPSPTLDSINYWFLNKSVNLFGESFLKSMVMQKNPGIDPIHIYDTATRLLKNFWSSRGIDRSALNIYDGSGLSPANRITTAALVTVMQYAKKQNWFSSFYNALPLMNGIKMKSGYIGGVRSYTGYIKGKTGNEYTFAIIVNNFDGNPGTVREKMWRLLDILK